MKKTFSMLLALALVFGLVLIAAPAAEATGHTDHCACAGNYTGEGHTCETDLTGWQDLNAVAETWFNDNGKDKFYYAPTGKYYLSADFTFEHRIRLVEDANVTICLNGFNMSTGEATAEETCARMFDMNSGVLNLTDCKGTGKFISHVVYLETSSVKTAGTHLYLRSQVSTTGTYNPYVVNIFGGVLETTAPVYHQSMIYNNGCNVNIYNGVIKGGNSNGAGGVMNSITGEVNMYGGLIEGGNAKNYGGNIRVGVECAFSMYGGEIKDGVSTGSKNGQGGNIFVGGLLNLYGGKITGGSAELAGNSIYVSGNAVVNLVNLDADASITLANTAAVLITNDMDASLQVGGTELEKVITKSSAPVEPPVTEPTTPPTTEAPVPPTTKPAEPSEPAGDSLAEEQVPTDFTTIIIVVSVIVAAVVAIGVLNIIKKNKAK